VRLTSSAETARRSLFKLPCKAGKVSNQNRKKPSRSLNLSCGRSIDSLCADTIKKKKERENLQARKDKRRFNKIMTSTWPTIVKRRRISQRSLSSNTKKSKNIQCTCPKCHIGYHGGNNEPAWVACDDCGTWYHVNCADNLNSSLSPEELNELDWLCVNCQH